MRKLLTVVAVLVVLSSSGLAYAEDAAEADESTEISSSDSEELTAPADVVEKEESQDSSREEEQADSDEEDAPNFTDTQEYRTSWEGISTEDRVERLQLENQRLRSRIELLEDDLLDSTEQLIDRTAMRVGFWVPLGLVGLSGVVAGATSGEPLFAGAAVGMSVVPATITATGAALHSYEIGAIGTVLGLASIATHWFARSLILEFVAPMRP